MKLEDLQNNQLWVLEEGYYQGRLKTIKKSSEQLQPIYEGFINALEAIKLSKLDEGINKTYEVIIRLFLTSNSATNIIKTSERILLITKHNFSIRAIAEIFS